jgi:hypothetical protein
MKLALAPAREGLGGKAVIEDERVLVAAETVIDQGFLYPINPI